MFDKIADKVGFIPLPYFACGAILFVTLVAGCTSETFAGDCHVRQQVVQQVVVPAYVQQFAVVPHQQQIVVRQQFVQPHRQQVVVQQFNAHQQQAVVVQKVQVQKPQRQVVRQRIITRSR